MLQGQRDSILDVTMGTATTSLPSIFPSQSEVDFNKLSMGGKKPSATGNATLDALLNKARETTSTAANHLQHHQSVNSVHQPQQQQLVNAVNQQPQQLVNPAQPQQQQQLQQQLNQLLQNQTFQQSMPQEMQPAPLGLAAQQAPQNAQYTVPAQSFAGLQSHPSGASQTASLWQNMPSLPAEVAPAPGEDLTSESLLLQQHLARQTDEMQQYLQGEMSKLSTAIRMTAAGMPADHTSPLRAYTSLPAASPLQQQHLPASPATPLAPSNMTQEVAALQRASPPKQIYPTRFFKPTQHVLSLDEAQKRLQSPVWEVQQTPTPAEGGGGGGGGGIVSPAEPEPGITKMASYTTCTTSLPTIHCFDSVPTAGGDQAAPPAQLNYQGQQIILNPPSASGTSDMPQDTPSSSKRKNENLDLMVELLKRSLTNVDEAPKAMGYAQMLAALDTEKVIDVLHGIVQHMQRKEVSLTWRALISQYQAAAERGDVTLSAIGQSTTMQPFLLQSNGVGAGGGAGGSGSGVGVGHPVVPTASGGCTLPVDQNDIDLYDLEDSLPPTPKSSIPDSDLSRMFRADGVATTLVETMNFIDKPLSPRSMKRMQNIRHKAAAAGGLVTTPSPSRTLPVTGATPAAMSPTSAQAFSIPYDVNALRPV